ncbi:PREDICTED: LOW QUALITY PROTEIN: zinc finger protein 571-like [Camelina sativa]|uniref:LOW QUALITY PROTEIN: zinc finger protein 571-like n=1 Tax=Camelina sativa TaxID=90675 RepID=A0ABM0ZEJ6_CAMSA|nr:PREDICTED: LOW QUALITY PROTEIN: zinc finger protein 571-like [Camelina sativa]
MSLKEHEMEEAAMSLVMLSERVCDFDLPPGDDDSMDLDKLIPIQKKSLGCVESIQDFREMVSHSGFEKSTTCSDDVVVLRSDLQSNSSHKCNVCGNSFGCYQALGGHKRLHRSIKEKLESKKENTKDDSSLFFGSSEDKKIVSIPSSFEVFQKEKILDCVVSRQDFRELLPSVCKFQKRPESSSSYKCKVCDKSFECLQGLDGHKGHNSLLEREKKYIGDNKSLSYSAEAKKTVSKPSSFEVSQEKVLHCVELKQDFSELLSYSSKTSFSALPSTLRSELQKDTQSKSSYDCNICGESFVRSISLSNHQRVHRPNREKLSRKRKYTKDHNPLSDSLQVSQGKILHCVESKQDFSELLSHPGFDKSISCSIIPLSSSLRSKSQSSISTRLFFVAVSLVMLSQRVYDFASIRNLPLGGDDVMDLEIKPLRSKLQKKTHSGYKCCKCDKSFGCYQVLGGHQRLHRSIEGQLAHKREYTKDDNSLSDSSEAKKIVTQPSSFEVFQEEKNLQCVEPRLEFHELLAHSGFDKSGTCSMTRFSALPSTPEARKIVSHPSSFGVSQEKIFLHCAESKLDDFRELLVAHSGFDKSSSCSKTKFSALHSPLGSKSHSSYRFKICGKSFVCSQALGGHQTLH